jgi:hypothetical protein
MPWVGGIPQDRDSHDPGNRRFEEFELFDAQVRIQGRARDVPARAPEVGDKAQLDRIRSVHHDDRDRRRRPPGGKGSRRVGRDDHVNLEAHKFGREVIESLRLPFCIAPLDGNVQPFDVPHFTQALPLEFRDTGPQTTDSEDLPRLLRLGGARRDEEAASQSPDECSPVDHSIT